MGLIWSKNPQLAITASEQGQQHGQVDLSQSDVEENTTENKPNIQLELIKFKEELDRKKQERRNALEALNRRMCLLKEEKDKEHEEKEKLLEILELMKLNEDETINRVKKLEEELKFEKEEKERWMNEAKRNRAEEELDVVKSEEVESLERHVKALKDVAAISAEMLKIREMQVTELKAKLTAIEETGQAYEKEVDNMRRLRALYDERARAVSISHKMELDRERARLVASEAKLEIAEQKVNTLEEKKSELNEIIESMDKSLDEAKSEISELKLELAGKREELYNATSQMAIINQLFSQVLSGPDGLERVTRVLEEHHDLVNHLTAKGKINNLASTLLELADQGHEPTEEEQDIAANLSKVWRLLVELLGHHSKPVVPGDTSPNSCYKSVDTPKGPKLVISVSQTFLRLKDLILEKNSLVKEVGRLKELNSTLESRLVEQESRLVVVADELHQTWDIVNRLQTQHKHLHTNEKVLRYELAQKRLLLNELKKELENCKESWELARAKNSQTEEDWRILRKEFASRKQISSAESGYEESPVDSQDEEEWSAKDDNSRDEIETEPDVSRDEPDAEEIKDEAVILPANEIGTVEGDKTEESKDEKESNNEVVERPASTTLEDESSVPRQRTAEEILKAREDRLKRLEEQCKGLFNKMNQTSQRSDIISSRLVELHEQYGEEGRMKRQRTLSSSDAAGTSSSDPLETTENLATATSSETLIQTQSLENNPMPNQNLDPDPKT